MLKNYFLPKLHEICGQDFNKQIFQQDASSCHTSKKTLKLLKTIFGDKIISNKCEFAWPAYSPDLNPCNFSVWGAAKDEVYSQKINNIEELKQKIIETFNRKFTPEMCKKLLII